MKRRLSDSKRRLSDSKRRLSDSKAYTSGPVDELFGQKPVLPLHDSDPAVLRYLQAVRQEAVSDRVFHTVKPVEVKQRSAQTAALADACGTDSAIASGTDCGGSNAPVKSDIVVSASFVSGLTAHLLSAKEPFKAAFDDGAAVSIDVAGLDFETESDDAESEPEIGSPHLQTLQQDASVSAEDKFLPGQDKVLPGQERFLPGEDNVLPAKHIPGTKTPMPKDNANEIPSTTEFPVPEAAGKWRSWVFSSPPPPHAWFFHLEHPTAIRLIILYTKWLSASMPESLSAWIFATFVRLDSAMDHADMASLRGLGKKAQKVHAASADGSSARETCRMVLALLSGYFGQKDLVSVA